MKQILSIMIVVLLVCSVPLTASAAEGNVTYSGNAGEFIFAPGGKESLTDLFSEFKDVMPGDSLTQKIMVKNNSSNGVYIYMRALGAHEDSKEFLSQMVLKVEEVDDAEMFKAAADETAQLTDWYCFGWMAPYGETEMKVVLEVPVSMGNEFMNRIGYLDWEFMVVELEPTDDDQSQEPAVTPPTQGESPKTGDNSNAILWMMLLFVSSCGMKKLLSYKRAKENI